MYLSFQDDIMIILTLNEITTCASYHGKQETQGLFTRYWKMMEKTLILLCLTSINTIMLASAQVILVHCWIEFRTENKILHY